ncbi:MAG: hypothetical protein ACMUIL_02075 [bacterium]
MEDRYADHSRGESIMKDVRRKIRGSISLTLVMLLVLLIAAATLVGVVLKIRSPAGKGMLTLAPPIETVWGMYNASLRGDIDGYLNCFTPESRQPIQATLESMGEEAFKEYLRNKAAGIMGISIYTPAEEELGNPGEWLPDDRENEGMISLPVEIVYKERNERQVFRLKRLGEGWRIVSASSPVFTPQPIPYGTNVNE